MKFQTLATVLVVAAMCVVRAQEKSATVTGYVLDSACAFIKNLKKPVSADCALASAKTGSPLAILGDDGSYWPISSVYIRIPLPEGLLEKLKPQQLRDLFAYLQSKEAGGKITPLR